MNTFEEQKEYFIGLIESYKQILEKNPKDSFVSPFQNFIKEEKYSTQRKLRNIREKEIECIYFAKNYQWFNQS